MRRPDVFTLDYSHPLAQGLILSSMMRRGRDESLRNLHGGLVNIPNSSWYFDDELGRPAVKFTGAGDYIDHPYKATAADLGAGVTLISWLKFGISGVSDEYIGAWGAPRLYIGKQSTNALVFGFGSAFDTYPSSAIIDEWACYAMVFDGADLTSYINGIELLSISKSFVGIQANNFGLGACIGTGRPMRGPVSDTSLYNRALSPAEIAILADRTDPMLGGLIVEERPVLYFDLGGSTTDELTAPHLTVSSPVLGTPSLAQTHALTASGITVEGPVLGAPTLAQIHALVASGLTVSAPVVGTPELAEVAENTDALFADDLVVGSPALGTPAIGQVHALTVSGLVTSSPVLGTPAVSDGTEQPATEPVAMGTMSGGTVYPLEADDLVVLHTIRKFLEVVDAQLG